MPGGAGVVAADPVLLQALPQEPLPRSFVFAEAPAMAAAEVYRPAESTGFRMPGWAYAGAAAVAGLAVIVFFLSGAVGTWLPQGAEDESRSVASTSALEMAQAESVPAPAAMREALPEAPASAPPADSFAPQETGAAAEAGGEVEGVKEVEVAKEVVVERVEEAQVRPDPTAVPVMAAPPQAAAMADVPPPTAAPAAAQEATVREPEVEARVEEEITVPQATTGHAGVESETPAVEAQADAVASAPADGAVSSEEKVAATATPGPVARSGELAEPALTATVAPATAQDAERTAEEPPATPLPRVTVPAIAPDPAIVAPTATPIATVPAPMPTLKPAVPTATAAAIAGAGVAAEPTELPTLKTEPDRTEPDMAAGSAGPRGPAGPSSQVPPAGLRAEEGARGPAGPLGGPDAPAPMPTPKPAVPTATAAAIAGAGVVSEPTEIPTLKMEPDRAESDLAPGGVEPEGPVGPSAQAAPAGPTAAEGAKGPAGPQGDQGPRGPVGPQGDSGAAGPAGVAGTGAAGLLRDDSALTVLLGVVVATAVLLVALLIALRIRAARGSGDRPGTNYGQDTSTLVNRPKLEN